MSTEASIIESHYIMRLDIGKRALDALMDTRYVAEDAIKTEVLRQIEFDHTPYLPDKNGVYPYYLRHEDNVIIVAICKVRAFNKAKQMAGWYVGIITPDELEELEEADIADRDDLMLGMLTVPDIEAAKRWVTHY